jgi:hypothetical protein
MAAIFAIQSEEVIWRIWTQVIPRRSALDACGDRVCGFARDCERAEAKGVAANAKSSNASALLIF